MNDVRKGGERAMGIREGGSQPIFNGRKGAIAPRCACTRPPSRRQWREWLPATIER
jgi:hypothetical protein